MPRHPPCTLSSLTTFTDHRPRKGMWGRATRSDGSLRHATRRPVPCVYRRKGARHRPPPKRGTGGSSATILQDHRARCRRHATPHTRVRRLTAHVRGRSLSPARAPVFFRDKNLEINTNYSLVKELPARARRPGGRLNLRAGPRQVRASRPTVNGGGLVQTWTAAASACRSELVTG